MSHPDPLFDPDNALEDDMNYDDYNDFYNDSMDGDHDSAMTSCGWGTDEDYGYYGEDVDYREDFHSDDSYGCYGEDY
jgi:hypothetical protein